MLIRRGTLLSGVGLRHVRKLVDDDQDHRVGENVNPPLVRKEKAAQFMRTTGLLKQFQGIAVARPWLLNSIAWRRVVISMGERGNYRSPPGKRRYIQGFRARDSQTCACMSAARPTECLIELTIIIDPGHDISSSSSISPHSHKFILIICGWLQNGLPSIALPVIPRAVVSISACGFSYTHPLPPF